MLHHTKRARKKRCKRNRHHRWPRNRMGAEQWDEDSTSWQSDLFLDAGHYKPEQLFAIGLTNAEGDGPYLVSPAGAFAYRNRILPPERPLALFPRGTVSWDGPVVIPMLIDMALRQGSGETMKGYSEKYRAKWGAIWMSMTPAEMISQRPGVRRAVGKVVIGGLGMGWFLRKVCENTQVEHVVVVERSQDLLEWYGLNLCCKQPKVADVICDDIYRHIGKHGDAVYLLDVWPTYEGVREDGRFWDEKRKHGDRLWGWGEPEGE